MQLKPFRLFSAGEIVAYSVSELAAAEQEHRDRDKERDNNNSERDLMTFVGSPPGDDGALESETYSSESLRYAVVVSVITPQTEAEADNTEVSAQEAVDVIDVGLRRVLLKVGGDLTVSLLCTQVYSFKSARELHSLKESESGKAARTSVNSSPTKPPKPGAGAGKKSSVAAGAASARSANIPPPLPPAGASKTESRPNLDPIRQTDVTGALNGLLLRAGIPVSLEQTQMAEMIVDLQNKQRKKEHELEGERKQLQEALGHLSKFNSAFKCQVCFTNDFDTVLAPCGHCVCGKCAEQLNGAKCPFCRQRFNQKVKMYLPDAADEATL